MGMVLLSIIITLLPKTFLFLFFAVGSDMFTSRSKEVINALQKFITVGAAPNTGSEVNREECTLVQGMRISCHFITLRSTKSIFYNQIGLFGQTFPFMTLVCTSLTIFSFLQCCFME